MTATDDPRMEVEIDLPSDWVQDRDRPGQALVAQPPAWHGDPTPSVTVTHGKAPGIATLAEYVDVQVAGLAATFTGTLISLDVDEACAEVEIGLAHELLGVDLTSVQRHLLGPGGQSVVATATAMDIDWADLAPTLLDSVRSMRGTAT